MEFKWVIVNLREVYALKPKYDFMSNGYNFVKIIARILGADFIKEEYNDGVEFIYIKTGKRLLKLIDSSEKLIVRFDYPVPDINKNTKEVHHEDHMHWDYEGEHIEDIITLIEISLNNLKKQ